MKRMVSVLVALIVAAGALQATAQTAAAQKSGASMAAKKAQGMVGAVAADSLTVKVSGKDMTFAVDKVTKVFAKGAGTATQAAGGNIAFTKLVGVGDTVSVSYAGTGPAMRATEVRITVSASRAPTPAGR